MKDACREQHHRAARRDPGGPQGTGRRPGREHPGVDYLYRQGDVLLGGEIDLLQPLDRGLFPGYYYEPHELRKLLAERGWKKVVGFQTRNPVHRAHEYIQKSALET